MQHQKIKGLVIRETNFGEANRYITVLTEQGIKIEVLCKNARNSRLSAAIRIFCFSEFTLYQKNDKYTLNDAMLLHSFWGVTQNVEIYALSCYFAECVTALAESTEHQPQITKLILYALRAISEQKREQKLVKAAFELKIMAICGFAPDLSICGACLKPINGQVYFSVREGVIIDESCKNRIGKGDFVALSSGTYQAMKYILSKEKIFAFTLGQDSLNQLSIICEQYMLYHLARGFASLDFYKTLF